MSRILQLLGKGLTTKTGRGVLGNAAGTVTDLGILGLGAGGLMSAYGTVTNLPTTWKNEAAAELDADDDIAAAYKELPWYKQLALSQGELESKVKSSEMREFKKDPTFIAAQGYLNPEEMPDLSGVDNKGQARAVIGKAVRDVKQQRATAADEREFLSLGNRYLMEQAERARRDSINERADTRMQQMEMYKMGIEREDRRDRRDARTQLVAALVGSLDNLGSAFVSI